MFSAQAQAAPPAITTQPQSLTNLVATTATFTVAATGTQPLTYQWFFQGSNLVANATNASLVRSNLQPAQAGNYTVVVTNESGSATSAVASLTVLPAADLVLAMSSPASPVQVGSPIAFTLNVTNRGPSSASALALVSMLSPNAQFLSASTTLGACTSNGNTITCSVSGLAPGSRFTLTLNALAGSGTNLCSASVAGLELDPFPTNNTASRSILGIQTLDQLSNADTIFLDEVTPNPGSVYPAIINVSGVTAQVFKVTVTLRGIAHDYPDDLDILLVGPRGQKVLLMSDCGLDNPIVDVTVTLDDEATEPLPDSDPVIVTGSYQPSNYGVFVDTFAAPAPPGPYASQLAAFRNTDPNGDWSLYVMDDSPENGGFVAEGWSLTLVTSDALSDFAIGQRASASSLPVGSNLLYTLAVTNLGPAGAAAIVTDTLPAGVTFVSATPSQGSCSILGQTVTCALGTMPDGATAQIVVVVRPTIGGTITNLASVASEQADLNPINNDALPLVTTVLPAADLAVQVAAVPAPALFARPLAYTVTITNRGPNTAANVLLTDGLPALMIFTSAVASQGGCTNAAGVISCALGPVVSGGFALVTITGRPGTVGSSSNLVSVTSGETDLVPSDNSTNVIIAVLDHADLQLAAMPSASNVLLGQDWAVTLVTSNLGPGTTAATLASILPPGLQFISATPSQGSCTNAAGTLTCQFGFIGATQSVSLSLLTRPSSVGSITNTFNVSGLLLDGNPTNNTVLTVASVLANANLDLRLTDAPDPVWLGENITYTLTVTNTGPNTTTGVGVTNTLPTNLTFVASSASQGSCFRNSNTVTCTLGLLAPGSGAVITISARAGTTGFITNSARAGSALPDPALTNNLATQTTRVLSPSGQFASLTPISIPTLGAASPYPSTIFVSGLTASVFRVRATLTNLAHSYPADLDVLLVGPDGQAALLLSDAGGEFAVTNLTLTFDEDAPLFPSGSAPLTGGVVHPVDYEPGSDLLPPPAPPGPYGTDLAVFRNTNPNGLWSLFVLDDSTKDGGLIAGGWNLTFSTLDPIADVLVAQQFSANPAAISNTLSLSYAITNLGLSPATELRLTNALDPSLAVISAVASQGGCTNDAGVIRCELGSLALGASALVTVQVAPTATGTFTNRVLVSAAQLDVRPENNVSTDVVEIELPPVITLHPASLTVTNGDVAVLTAAATGSAPVLLQWQRNGVNVPGATNGTLVLSNATSLHSGNYRVRASNRVGTVFSDAALLRVLGPPSLSDLPDQTIDEDTPTGFIPFTVEDAESAASLLTLSGHSSNTNLVLETDIVFTGTSTNRTVRVTPRPDAYGQAVISVTALDPDGGDTTRSFQLTVRPVNDPPSLSGLPDRTTPEATPFSIAFLADDLETAPDSLSYFITSSNPTLLPTNNVSFGGTNTARTAILTPATNETGSATITIHADDGAGGLASASFLLVVTPLNRAPTLDEIPDLTIDEDSGPRTLTLTGITSGRASELQNMQMTVESSNPAILAPPSLTYNSPAQTAELTLNPLTNAAGSTVVTVTVTDGGTTNQTFSRQFTVTVSPVNDPPRLLAVSAASTTEDVPIFIPILLHDPDDATALLALSVSSLNTNLVPASGLLLGGTGATRSLLITPAPNANGTASIRLVVTDPHGASFTNLLTLSVVSANDPPTINSIADRAIPEDSATQSVPLSGLSGGPADEAQSITLTAVSSNPALIPNPSITHTNPNSSGTLTFRPNTNANGSAVITVTASDTEGSQFARTFTVTVTAVNDPPVINVVSAQSTAEDTPVTVAFLIEDAENPAASLSVTGTSSNPALLNAAAISMEGSGSNRTVNLRPLPDQSGTASITLTVSDGAATNSTTFALTVNAVNDPPTLNPLTNVALIVNFPNTDLPFNGVSSGASNESQPLTVSVVSSNTALITTNTISYASPATNGTFRLLSPSNTGTGTGVVAVTVSDGVASITRTFTVFVFPSGNAMPAISAMAGQVTAEDTPTAAIPFTVGDSGTPANLLTPSSQSSNTNLVPPANIVFGGSGSNRTVTITPATNQSGTAAITLYASDTNFGLANRTFTLTVNAVNDLPQISSLTNRSTPEDSLIQIPFTIGDVETAAGALGVTAVSSNLTLVPGANLMFGGSGSNRVLLLTPGTNQIGTTTITLRVSDGAATNSTSFQLTVTGVNDPPAISSIAAQTTTKDTPAGPIAFNVQDVETPAGSLTLSATSSVPALIATGDIAFGGAGSIRTVTLTPRPAASGSALITLTVTDGNGATASSSFTLTVSPVNAPPSLDPIAHLRVNAGTAPLTVVLTGIAAGPGETNQVLAVVASTPDTSLLRIMNMTYSGGATGSLTLETFTGATGTGLVVVTVFDGGASNNFISRTFAVAINSPPTIGYVPDQSTLEGTPTTPISIPIGDDATAPAALVVSVSSTSPLLPPGSAQLGGVGAQPTLILTPAANLSGTAFVTIAVLDAEGLSRERSFFLTVIPVNAPPTLDSIPNLVVPLGTGLHLLQLGGISTGATNEIEDLTLTAASSDTNVVVITSLVYSDGASTAGLTLRSIGSNGAATVTVTVSDGQPVNSTITRAFTVTLNSPPTISGLTNQVTAEDTALAIPFTIGDADSPADQLTVAVAAQAPLIPPSNAVLVGIGAARTLTLTPAAGFFGAATVTVSVTDPLGASNSVTFTLMVTHSNRPPTLNAIADLIVNPAMPRVVPLSGIGPGATNESDQITLSAQSSDTNVVAIASLVYSNGSSATLTLLPAGTNGSATITVIADDGQAENHATTNRFTVAINTPPSISPISNQVTAEDIALAIPFTIGDAHSPANQLTVAVAAQAPLIPPSNAVLVGIGAARTLTLTPAAGFFGAATVTISVTDPLGASNSVTFTLSVTHSNRPPTLNAIADLILNPATPRAVPLSGIGPGATNENDLVTLSAQSSDTNVVAIASLVYSNGSSATLTLLAAGTNGAATITVIADDGQPQNHVTTNRFTVAINTPPLLPAISNQTMIEDIAITVPFTLSDDFTAASSLVVTGYSSSWIVPPWGITFGGTDSNRTVTVLSLTNHGGPTIITIATTDGHGLVSSNSFDLFIVSLQDLLDIIVQPVSTVVLPGDTATLTCVAFSTSTLHYQWRKNGVDIPGAIRTNLVITNAQAADAANYTCFVRNNDQDTELSLPATLYLFTGPAILSIAHSNSVATVTYVTFPSSTNTLEFKRPVNATNWIPLNTSVATGVVMRVPDPFATNSSGFYRIRTDR